MTADWLQSGIIKCPDCNKPFEATAFRPPQRRLEAVGVAGALTPEGANACANHARNAAVTNCVRCGLFICALCNMDVGTGPHCPSCFDRLRADDALSPAATRYRDYASMARVAMIAGIFFSFIFMGIPFAAVSLYYARKGFKQLRDEGRSKAGLIIIVIVAILEIIGGIAWVAVLIVGLSQVKK
ncbi:MAG TPA: hypothetical protein VGQ46_19070 [Thermoanaerobaculia bacterium]|nr:hypothetical protein [Thermoanaerobaculia bacterium]